MKSLRLLLLPLLALIIVSACDNNTSTIGNTLVTDKAEVIVDSAFTVSITSVPAGTMRSRTISQLLGNIQADGFGSLRSDFVTQFMPTSMLDTVGITGADVDSLRLILRFRGSQIIGDSLVPMGLQVYPLTKQLPYNIYSDFDPTGYYDPAVSYGTTMYTGNAMYNDSLATLATHVISVPMPTELGRHLFDKFRTNPELYLTPEGFASLYPGVYVKGTFGSGRVTNIYNTRLAIYFHENTTYYVDSLDQYRDTTYYYSRVLAASSPEAVSNNCLDFTLSSQLAQRAAAGEALIVSPLGLNARLTFPVNEIVDSYRHNATKLTVLNTLTLRIPTDSIPNAYNIQPPKQLLMVLEKDYDKFFEEFRIPDSKTSFLLTYSRGTGDYVLSDMRDFIMQYTGSDAPASPKDCTFILVPVTAQTETYQPSMYSPKITVVTDVLPEVATPAMVKILPEQAKIKLTYSKQTINNL